MAILSDRWHGLRSLPHYPLSDVPTPVEVEQTLSKQLGCELWIKRDDLSGRPYGGNKVRKLEYLIGDALSKNADTLITAGAAGSHHVLATAIYGEKVGLSVHAVVCPQYWTPHVEDNIRATLARGAQLYPTSTALTLLTRMSTLSAKLKVQRQRVHPIPPGGSSLTGLLGYVEAGLELARQIEAKKMPEPEAIFLPFGTGGTAIGLSIGLAASGISSPIVAVRVVPSVLARRKRITKLVRQTVKHLRNLDSRFPAVSEIALGNLTIDNSQIGQGYGRSTPAGTYALNIFKDIAGLQLDQNYSAKAAAGMVRYCREQSKPRRVLFIHTLNSVSLPQTYHAPAELPKAISRLLKGRPT